ncbi:MAG: TetR family transcriptional regulator [Myxococcales bacterium]|nr:TetR family transcriptional regulator [Myxococcales bacterium]
MSTAARAVPSEEPLAEEHAGLRAQHRRRVRDALVTSALSLFKERGFEHVTVDDVAKMAGVSRRTFFRHFATKEDVVMERRRRQLHTFAALLEGDDGRPALERVREACLSLADDFEAQRERVLAERALVMGNRELVARDMEVDRELEQVIVGAFAAHEGRRAAARRGGGRAAAPSIEARWMAAAVVGIVRVTLDDWAEGGGRTKLRAMGERGFTLLAGLERART